MESLLYRRWMLGQFPKIVAELGLDPTTDGVVVAVSGGMDSMVCLENVIQIWPRNLIVVAHVNHGLRGEESDGDEHFVREYCKTQSLEFKFLKSNSSERHASENRLRMVRKEFLEEVRRNRQFRWILTGHHLDDNLETFLMRLVRGTSVKGLGAMGAVNGHWVKPLLTFSRSAIEEWARMESVKYRSDSSNLELRYLRNRVRHRLIPVLDDLAMEFGGGEAFRRRFAEAMGDLKVLSELLEASVSREYSRLVSETPFFFKIGVMHWRQAQGETRRGLIHRILTRVSEVEMSRRDVESVERVFLNRGKGVSLLGGVELSISMGAAFFIGPRERENLEKLPLWRTREIRRYQPGDRFEKSGQRVGRLLIKRGIPRPERALVELEVNPTSNQVLRIIKVDCGSPSLLTLHLGEDLR